MIGNIDRKSIIFKDSVLSCRYNLSTASILGDEIIERIVDILYPGYIIISYNHGKCLDSKYPNTVAIKILSG